MSSHADSFLSPTSRRLLFVISLTAGIACSGLGVWQLRRLVARRAANARAIAERAVSVVDLNQTGLELPVSYRRVVARGTYDFAHEIVLRGRLLGGSPGIHVYTPLKRVDQDTSILVNRGFVPTPDAGAIADPRRYGEDAEARVSGIAISIPDERDGQPLSTRHGETWRRLDLTALRGRLPYPIAAFSVIAQPDSGIPAHTLKGHELPVRVDPPPLDDGPHLTYAVQWFLIGGAAIGFGVVFVLGANRRRAEPNDPPTS